MTREALDRLDRANADGEIEYGLYSELHDLVAVLSVPEPAEVEWESVKWHELKADDEETGTGGDTIRLTWEDGTVLIGRLTVPLIGSGHHQVCRMQTVFGGDTYVFAHGSTLTRRVPVEEGAEQ